MKPYESIYSHYVTVKPFVFQPPENELETAAGRAVRPIKDRGKFIVDTSGPPA
jgi:hypothetical protein